MNVTLGFLHRSLTSEIPEHQDGCERHSNTVALFAWRTRAKEVSLARISPRELNILRSESTLPCYTVFQECLCSGCSACGTLYLSRCARLTVFPGLQCPVCLDQHSRSSCDREAQSSLSRSVGNHCFVVICAPLLKRCCPLPCGRIRFHRLLNLPRPRRTCLVSNLPDKPGTKSIRFSPQCTDSARSTVQSYQSARLVLDHSHFHCAATPRSSSFP